MPATHILIEYDDTNIIDEGKLLHDFEADNIDELLYTRLNEVIDKEIEVIVSKEIMVIKRENHDNQIVIDKLSYEKWDKENQYLNHIIYECDEKGNKYNRIQALEENDKLKIRSVKDKIITDYFNSKGIIDLDRRDKGIKFSCNICHPVKTNQKCWIWYSNFRIMSHSHSDCRNETHEKVWNRWTKELKKLWDESKEKKQLVFNMSEDYLRNVVTKYFPKILKQKNTCCLFKWNGTSHYIEMMDTGIKSEIESLIYEHYKKENDEVLTTKELRDVKSWILRSNLFPEKDFEQSRLYNCKNGVLDIETKKLMSHSDKYFFNYCSNIEYNIKADTEELYNFITQVVSNKDPIDLISKVIAHIYYQGKKLQKGFLFLGTKRGRNGKGTLVELIQEVIGEGRYLSTHLSMFNKSSFTTYDLKDKALYVEDDYKLDYLGPEMVELLNTLISQGGETVHQKNRPAIQIKHTAVPIIECNQRPKIKAMDDGGFYDRWITVNFNNEYGDCMNENLGEQLLNNPNVMSSMLNLLINGYHMILERKNNTIIGPFFGSLDDERNQIKEWKKENNSVLQFIDDCCELNNMYCCSSRELYLIYRNDWNLNGSKLSETKFVKTIKEELKLKNERRTIKGIKTSIIMGLKCNVNVEFGKSTNLSIRVNSL
jgi:P4 family phage/plasmid primase-like protien